MKFSIRSVCCLTLLVGFVSPVQSQEIPRIRAQEAPRTTLANNAQSFQKSPYDYVVLKRGGIEAIVVNNAAVDNSVLPGHRGGYSGLASLKRLGQTGNLFVPSYAGLNFEHIHDGTTRERDVLFEPRNAPMELRVIDQNTVELYQPATPTWGLESATRYHILEDGTIEMVFECIPRRDTFRHDYIGLFWASYIQQPASLDIHFRGRKAGQISDTWIQARTPQHGVESTHLQLEDQRSWKHDEDFPLTLVFNRSKYRYSEPFYFGVNQDSALVSIFRPKDQIRMTQSPSGGGVGNPAWDFQWMIPDYKIDQRYQMVMRLQVIPYQDREDVWEKSRPHREALR